MMNLNFCLFSVTSNTVSQSLAPSPAIVSPLIIESSDANTNSTTNNVTNQLRIISDVNSTNNTINQNQINNQLQTTSLVQKLILYKSNANMNSTNDLSQGFMQSNNNSCNNQVSNKSLKIVSTTPIVTSHSNVSSLPPSTSSNLIKPIMFNVNSGVKQASLINKLTTNQQLIPLAQAITTPSLTTANAIMHQVRYF